MTGKQLDERLLPPSGAAGVTVYGYDPTTDEFAPVAGKDRGDGSVSLNVGGLVPEEYDEILLTYDASNCITTVVYRKAGATIATLTLTYDAPGGNLTHIVRS